MRYHDIRPAVFQARPNRFVAQVTLPDGTPVRAHVKNTGRCAELLVPGAKVYLEYAANPRRATPCDLVAVEKPTPRGTLGQHGFGRAQRRGGGVAGRRRPGPAAGPAAEQTFGDSRFDFAARQGDRPVLVEVKGLHAGNRRRGLFPRRAHAAGTEACAGAGGYAARGWRCCVLVVIQMAGVHCFRPNWATQPAFGQALRQAAEAGVELRALDCTVTPGSIALRRMWPVDLTPPAGTDSAGAGWYNLGQFDIVCLPPGVTPFSSPRQAFLQRDGRGRFFCAAAYRLGGTP